MGRYHTRLQCGHSGCPEWTIYEHDTRREQRESYARHQGKWLCVRHSQPNEVLGAGNLKTVSEVVSDQRPHGVYWGNWGFVSGPGFKAFAKDFPPGTMLRVTAEIVLPLATTSPEGE